MGHNKPPYYLTAYGLAVKEGFKGTLAEWLASLHGDGVQLRYQEEKLQWRSIKGAEEPDPEEGWQDLLDVAGTRQAIFETAMNGANRAEEAAGRAEAAADDAAAALARTEEVADSVGSPVSYKPQTIPEKNKVQAKENIDASTFYHTTRDEVGVAHEDINAEYIYGLYRALMAEYPNNVQEKEYKSTDGTFNNYEYVISTGDFAVGAYVQRDGSDGIKKPKFLVLSGIDGNERKTVFSTYRFVRDILRGHNVPKSFKEGAVLHVLPVGSPWGFSEFNRWNENDVYIENNFDCEWDEDKYKSGEAAASEKETQAITNWLNSNADADLFISYHNSGGLNEIVAILGDSTNDATDIAKKIALQGVARVIPFWKDVIGYPLVFKDVLYLEKDETTGKFSEAIGDRETIFSYSAATRIRGSSFLYAQEKLGIPSFVLETPAYYGTYQEWLDNETVYQPEPISAGAEALGNILIEYYEQSVLSKVNGDMNEMNGKIDQLLQRTSFRIETGSFTPTTHLTGEVSLDIPAGAKMVEIIPQGTVSKGSSSLVPVSYLFASVNLLGNSVLDTQRGAIVEYYYTKYGRSPCPVDLTNGFTVTLDSPISFEAGVTYNWTAYYWDESGANAPDTEDIIGDIDSALDGILAIQNKLMGGEAQ